MIIHPQFNPVALQLGPLSIHWYALSYLLGFALFTILGRWRIRHGLSALDKTQLDDLLTYGVLGVILGGRLGYVFFYQAAHYLAYPMDILKVWQGGMSFHGGLLGVLFAMWLFGRRKHIHFAAIADTVAPLVPLGLASGRIGNFINGELWGRITAPDAWWAMGFPQAAQMDSQAAIHASPTLQVAYAQYHLMPRHPSQLYEFLLEGVVLFLIVWLFSRTKKPMGQTAALFLFFYGLFRFTVEFTREPDDFLGLLSLGLSMGQWLSLPMMMIGLLWFIIAAKQRKNIQ